MAKPAKTCSRICRKTGYDQKTTEDGPAEPHPATQQIKSKPTLGISSMGVLAFIVSTTILVVLQELLGAVEEE